MKIEFQDKPSGEGKTEITAVYTVGGQKMTLSQECYNDKISETKEDLAREVTRRVTESGASA